MDAAIEPPEMTGGTCTVRQFSAKKAESPETLGALPPDSQAGLRQFSLERMMGYGIDYADAVELRGKVLDGQAWRHAATDLAVRAIGSAEHVGTRAAEASQATLYYRASALLRMSQALMLQDTDERRETVERAVDCYERSAALRKDRRHVRIDTAGGPMAGWFLAAQGPATGSAIVIGGVEGWAMDFDSMGEALVRRGVNALLLDAPGQGETRIIHRHYLSLGWLENFRHAIDFVERALPDRPIGIIGNSMGGAIALAVTNNDTRITACCNNGGMIRPIDVRAIRATLFAKMVAFCGTNDEDHAAAVWETVQPVKPGPNTSYSLLVLQGSLDPLVPIEHGKMFMAQTPAREKHMEVFSDGDHCLYNHRTDRDILATDWMRARLDG